MRNRKIALSLVASSCLVSSLSATTIQLHQGWNLVGVTSKEDNGLNYQLSKLVQENSGIRTIITSEDGKWKSFDASVPESMWGFAQGFTELQPGKGYWIKVDKDSNLTIGDTPISLEDIQFQAGWNLVALPSSDISELIKQLEKSKLKLNTIITSEDGKWKSFDASVPENMWGFAQGFTSIDDGKGYWVKVQAVAGSATTLDGYNVELYSDKDNIDISSIKSQIENSKVADIASIDFGDISNIVISTSVDGVQYSSPYINTNSNFSTTLSSVLNDTLNPEKIKENIATSGTSIYVYAVSEGGAAHLLSPMLRFMK
ncbi:MAG TPA: hypothetical protein EYO61_02840 [Campylobacterales bacterium]|nr:hypothetical protein [Campylobacterales bacterium]